MNEKCVKKINGKKLLQAELLYQEKRKERKKIVRKIVLKISRWNENMMR